MKNTVYNLVEYNDASPNVKAVYDDSMKSLGLPFVLNWFKCQGNNEELLTGNWAKLKSTLVMGVVPNIVKQLIIYNVSDKKGCDYCSQAHGIFANMMGKAISEDPQFKITENMESELVPQSYRTAVNVVTRAALTPSKVSDSDFNELKEAGYNDTEIKELMAQADLVNMLNTIADISGIKLDSEMLEMAH